MDLQFRGKKSTDCEGLEVHCSVQTIVLFKVHPPLEQCCLVEKLPSFGGQSCCVIKIIIFSIVVFYLIFLASCGLFNLGNLLEGANKKKRSNCWLLK